MNDTGIDYIFESVYSTIIPKIQKSFEKGLSWIIDSVIDHTINISKDKPLSGSNYIKLPKNVDHPRKNLIIIPNIDDILKIVTYLYTVDHNAARIRKIDKEFEREFDFKCIKFAVKIRDIHNAGKKNVSALVFLVIKLGKKSNLYIKKILLRNRLIYY